MSKRTVFTTITPLPAGISRATVIETLHDHLEMIDANPSHQERHRIKPPPEGTPPSPAILVSVAHTKLPATPEEYHCTWYQITDKISYLPANLATGSVSFKACFHDLANGLQTHVYAPLSLDIKEKWTLGGTLPGEPAQPVEIGLGAPIQGLYLREDVEMRCNFLMTKFVKKTLKQSLETLVKRLVVRSQLLEAVDPNHRIQTYDPHQSLMSQVYNPPLSPPLSAPLSEPPEWFLEASKEAEMSKTRASFPQYGSPHPTQTPHQPAIREIGPGKEVQAPVELP